MTKVTIAVSTVSLEHQGSRDEALERCASIYEVSISRQPDGQILATFLNTGGYAVAWGNVRGLLNEEETPE